MLKYQNDWKRFRQASDMNLGLATIRFNLHQRMYSDNHYQCNTQMIKIEIDFLLMKFKYFIHCIGQLCSVVHRNALLPVPKNANRWTTSHDCAQTRTNETNCEQKVQIRFLLIESPRTNSRSPWVWTVSSYQAQEIFKHFFLRAASNFRSKNPQRYIPRDGSEFFLDHPCWHSRT
jgi:hypothetical protein